MLVSNHKEIRDLRKRVLSASRLAALKLKELAHEHQGIELLEQLRFNEIGRHPLEDRPLNLVEQVNQAFTTLVSLAAVEWLLARHPEAAPFQLNLGTARGTDVLGQQEMVAAEVFAAVRPGNNRKLAKDILKVAETSADYKYVFHYCPGVCGDPYDAPAALGVVVVPLSKEVLFETPCA